MRARTLVFLFSAARRPRRANILICVAAGTDDRRIANPSGKLVSESAGSRAAGNFPFFIQRRAVNRPGWRKQHFANRRAPLRWLDSDGRGDLDEAGESLLP